MSQTNIQNQSTKNIILSYLSYLSLFVGAGFVSGAIVHSGNIYEISKYAVIGAIGIALFLAGSFVQEFVLKKDTDKTGIVKFFFLSLLLSIGIGMISGGTQYFSDFPKYSALLIPLGLILSLIAFLFKNNYVLSTKVLASILGAFAIISIPLYLGLNTYASSLVSLSKEKCKTGYLKIKVFASEGHSDPNCSNILSKANKPKILTNDEIIGMGSMANGVVDDQSFLQEMIPHHQEAVDSSNQILQTTTNPELKTFAQNVIITQTKEINEMKTWYKTWFDKEYTPSSNYMAMMGGMNGKTGKDLDKEYVKGMLGHHGGAIEMAKMIQTITKRPEIQKLSNDIITSQSTEVKTLEGWLMVKYDDHNMAGDSH